MKIAALTMVYNEALILPYFFRHYEYLDEIHVLYETDSTDDTLKILNTAPNVIIKNCHIEGGMDDIAKVNLINDTLHGIKADWVYVVDPDEFIFPSNGSPDDFLSRQIHDVVLAAMFQVYRHRTDKDLDVSLPPIPQRTHGDPDVFSTVAKPNRGPNDAYVKPIVVRPSSGIRFLPGNHAIEGKLKIAYEFYIGAHWRMADPQFALDRIMKRRARLSERNKAQGMGLHNSNVTDEWIRAECDCHLDDPIIYALCPVSDESPAEITSLSNKAGSQKAVIVESRNLLREKQIRELNQKMHIKSASMEINSNVTWSVYRKFQGIINTIFPLYTRRRLLASRIFATQEKLTKKLKLSMRGKRIDGSS